MTGRDGFPCEHDENPAPIAGRRRQAIRDALEVAGAPWKSFRAADGDLAIRGMTPDEIADICEAELQVLDPRPRS